MCVSSNSEACGRPFWYSIARPNNSHLGGKAEPQAESPQQGGNVCCRTSHHASVVDKDQPN